MKVLELDLNMKERRSVMLNEISFVEIMTTLAKSKDIERPKLNISILRNITVDPLEKYLQYYGVKSNYDVSIKMGDYDTIMQDAMLNHNNTIADNTDVIILFSKLEYLSSINKYSYLELTDEIIENELNSLRQYISSTLSGIRKKSDALILWNSFEYPIFVDNNIVDTLANKKVRYFYNEANSILDELLSKVVNSYSINSNFILSRLGIEKYYDNRYWYSSKAPYRLPVYQLIAEQIFKFVNSIKGKSKKCLVLDCDNTLWGGIIGEDGLQGISLDTNYPGNDFVDFQKEIIKLYKRGIIIALCSKNNEEDVWEVFEKHPSMQLKKDMIIAHRINWNNKAENIKSIANELNIGLDSIVFMDDSEFEINLVKEQLPEVTAINLNKDESYNYKEILLELQLFDNLSSSQEDSKRNEMYVAEKKRKAILTDSSDIDSYYHSLEMSLVIQLINDLSFSRVVQLTQKTNQFNLTTQRYSESNITSFMESGNYEIYTLQLTDKFGDMGIIGEAIVEIEDNIARIDTFLMSCRALGRKVEFQFISSILEDLFNHKKVNDVRALYIPTIKNSQVKDFYKNVGFNIDSEDENQISYSLSSNDFLKPELPFFKLNTIRN